MTEETYGRRSFLKGMAATLLMMSSPNAALAAKIWDGWGSDPSEGAVLPDVIEAPKKENSRFCKGRLLLSSGLRPREEYSFNFRDEQGNYNQDVLNQLSWFLRCADGSWLHMDLGAIETLNYMSKTMDDPLIVIHSGYRSPPYNAKIGKSNENVARNSLHMYGRALDFSIKGVDTRTVCSHALLARNTIGFGGVGYYPRSGFVHLDSGPFRQWVR